MPDKAVINALRKIPQGLVRPGNIDLNARSVLKNPDGTISTIESMSFPFDGMEVLVPTIDPKGQRMTEQQAMEFFRKTGQHLGYFASPELATEYAKELSLRQGEHYKID